MPDDKDDDDKAKSSFSRLADSLRDNLYPEDDDEEDDDEGEN